MSSAINPNSIDNQYPVAGQDNNSQGFRDNFTAIKNNLEHAKAEITDLQTKAVLKAPLAGETTVSNSLAEGTTFSGAVFKDSRFVTKDLGTITIASTLAINNVDAQFQRVVLGGVGIIESALTFSGFPTTGQWAKLSLEVTVSNIQHTLVLPAVTLVNTDGIANYDALNRILSFPDTGVYTFEFATYNSGATLFITESTRRGVIDSAALMGISTAETLVVDNLSIGATGAFTLSNTPPTTNTGSTGDAAGRLAVDSSYLYVCVGNYDGVSSIWKRVGLSAWL
jgi:hypothetical protein